MVAVLKKFHPDVMITRFPTEGVETHGHHTASAILAVEAWKQLDRRVAGRSASCGTGFNFGGPPPSGEELPGLSKLDVGGFNPLLGVSYGEMAAQRRSMHKSQGFGAAPSRGESIEYFRVLAGEPVAHTIFDGIDLTWARVPGGKKIGEHVARIRAAFSPTAPARSIPALVAPRGEMQALAEHPWKAEKLAEVDEVIAGCAGLYAEAAAGDAVANPGGDVALTVTAINRSPATMTLREVRLPGGEKFGVDKPLGDNKAVKIEHTFKLPAETEYTQPYWLAAPPDKGHWTVHDPALIGRPETPAPNAELVVAVAGTNVVLERPLAYKWVDPVAGERWRPLEVLPPVSVTPRAPLLVFPDATAKRPLGVRVKANRDGAAGEVAPELAAGWSAEPKSAAFKLAKKGDETELIFKVHAPRAEGTATLKLVATVDGQRFSRAVGHVEYPHIPIQTVTPDADVKLLRADIHHKRTRVGYIPGAGDEVPAALRQAGYDVTMLTDETLAHGSLAPVSGHRGRRARVQRRTSGCRPTRPAHGLRRRRRHAGRAVQHAELVSADRRPDRPGAVQHLARPRHRGERRRADARSDARGLQRAEPDRRARLRRLGAGARPLLRRALGQGSITPLFSMHDTRRAAAKGSLDRREARQGRVRVHGPRLLPAAARGRARRLSALREPPLLWPLTTNSGRRSSAAGGAGISSCSATLAACWSRSSRIWCRLTLPMTTLRA